MLWAVVAIFRFLGRVLRILFLLALLALGWIAGDRWGLPEPVRTTVDNLLGPAQRGGADARRRSEEALTAGLENAQNLDLDLPSLPDGVDGEDFEIGVLPADDDTGDKLAGAEGGSASALSGTSSMRLCPGMSISNAPRANADGDVLGVPHRLDVGGVSLLVAPIKAGCFSSGYGMRGGRFHRGIDFHHPTGSEVLAAASGVVIEAQYRDDYGNYVLVDHGSDVFTRYAHLASFAGGLAPSRQVSAGQAIGMMGNTAGYSVPIHLHYEILKGDYDTPKRAFGLKPVNPLTGR
ncbi:MAG: M23 family metallopeptidase [Parvularcula sp.]|jgi:murein DD-endopeptidase MepM/ murein hydrolase activator NlpD|nr:M23 family metallopeptidase [Parvularcula sp.]